MSDTVQGLLEVSDIEDMLYIGVDFSKSDDDTLVVMRRQGTDIYVLNQFRNEEAVELYHKLIGEK